MHASFFLVTSLSLLWLVPVPIFSNMIKNRYFKRQHNFNYVDFFASREISKMAQIRSVFITGASRGLGLEFVKQLIELPNPPEHVFATCRNPDSAEVCVKQKSY